MKRVNDQKILLRGTALRIGLLFILSLPAFSGIAGSQYLSQNPASQNETDKAKELIKLARSAIGGEEALSRIQTIVAKGKYKRFIKYFSVRSPKKVEEKRKALPGRAEFEFAPPDKFRRFVTGSWLRRPGGYSYAQVVNGAEAWRDPPLPPASSSGDRRVIDVRDVERSAFLQATRAKQELSYYSIGWLMLPLSGYPLEMSYLGLYQLGSEKTHAIVAKGTSGFRFTLLLDVENYQPVAVAISFVEVIQPLVFGDAPGAETRARVIAERKARTPPPQPCELLIRFSDRRPVNGVMLPFRVTTALNGELVEEMIMSGFEINRRIDLKKFAQPKEK